MIYNDENIFINYDNIAYIIKIEFDSDNSYNVYTKYDNTIVINKNQYETIRSKCVEYYRLFYQDEFLTISIDNIDFIEYQENNNANYCYAIYIKYGNILSITKKQYEKIKEVKRITSFKI